MLQPRCCPPQDAEGCFLPPDCAGGEVERTLTRYLQALEALPKPLTRALLHFLGDPQPERMDALMTHPSMALRLNYYPPISTAEDQSGAGRLLGHEDVTFITLLPAPRTEGLQIFHRASRAWVRLQAARTQSPRPGRRASPSPGPSAKRRRAPAHAGWSWA